MTVFTICCLIFLFSADGTLSNTKLNFLSSGCMEAAPSQQKNILNKSANIFMPRLGDIMLFHFLIPSLNTLSTIWIRSGLSSKFRTSMVLMSLSISFLTWSLSQFWLLQMKPIPKQTNQTVSVSVRTELPVSSMFLRLSRKQSLTGCRGTTWVSAVDIRMLMHAFRMGWLSEMQMRDKVYTSTFISSSLRSTVQYSTALTISSANSISLAEHTCRKATVAMLEQVSSSALREFLAWLLKQMVNDRPIPCSVYLLLRINFTLLCLYCSPREIFLSSFCSASSQKNSEKRAILLYRFLVGTSLSLLNISSCLLRLQLYKQVVLVSFCLLMLLCLTLMIDVA